MNQIILDTVVVICANLFNLTLLGIMLAKIPPWKEIEFILKYIAYAFILPFGFVSITNLIILRSFWSWLFPGFLALLLALEVKFSTVLDFSSRDSRWIVIYSLLFYLGQWGLVIYSFLVNQGGGIVTLITYLLSLGATAYSYSKVKG